MDLVLKADKQAVETALQNKAETSKVQEIKESIDELEKKLTAKIDEASAALQASAEEAA